VGGLVFLIVYTVLIGLLELQFHFTVGEVLKHLIRQVTGAG